MPVVKCDIPRTVLALCLWNNHTGQTKCLYCGHVLRGDEAITRICTVPVDERSDEPLHAALWLVDSHQAAIRKAWYAFSPHTDTCKATNPKDCPKCAALVALSEEMETAIDESSVLNWVTP